VSSKTRVGMWGLLLVIMLLVWSMQSERFPSAASKPESAATADNQPRADTPREVILPIPPQRKIYPYSVIPGGIATIEELKAAMAKDPVVARHLENFNLEKASVVEVPSSRSVFLSYRKGSEIFWTKRSFTLIKGEKLITDGNRTLRARCGNDVSDIPAEPTIADEPSDTELDTAMPILEAQNRDFSDPIMDPWHGRTLDQRIPTVPLVPPLKESSINDSHTDSVLPPIVPPATYPGGGGPGSNEPDPPVSVPEPSSFLLLFVGAAGIGAEHIRRMRKQLSSIETFRRHDP
jgi:hypothetical protein